MTVGELETALEQDRRLFDYIDRKLRAAAGASYLPAEIARLGKYLRRRVSALEGILRRGQAPGPEVHRCEIVEREAAPTIEAGVDGEPRDRLATRFMSDEEYAAWRRQQLGL